MRLVRYEWSQVTKPENRRQKMKQTKVEMIERRDVFWEGNGTSKGIEQEEV